MYAAIVAAWAVYLVPMWLRREDELNRARQTRRYSAAIKVLSHKEAFDRRWAHSDESDANAAQLPIAAGQGPVAPPTRRDSAGPAKGTAKGKVAGTAAATDKTTAGAGLKTASRDTATAKRGPARKNAVAAASGKLGPVVSAPINSAWTAQDVADDEAEPTIWADEPAALETAGSTPARQQQSQSQRQPFAPQTSAAAPTATSTAAATATAGAAPGSGSGSGPVSGPMPRTAPRTGLMVRRRRMVTLLFAVSTIGALISADLGSSYIWAMITPAALLSAYIVWLRKDERSRAAERARRAAARAAQEQAKAAREAAAARAVAAEAEARAEEQAQAEALARTQAARRRAAAAARSRAQAYAPNSASTQAPAATQPPPRRAANE